MTTPLHNSIEEAYAELERQRTSLNDMKQRLESIQVTITSKNRALTVTVDSQGTVSEIKFLTSTYRTMAPAELGSLLVDTIAEARSQVTAQTTEILQQVLPGGSMLDVLTGQGDLDSMLDEAVAEAVASQSFFDLGDVHHDDQTDQTETRNKGDVR